MTLSKNRSRIVSLAPPVFLVAVLGAGQVHAQKAAAPAAAAPATAAAAPADPTKKGFKVERGAGGKKVYRLDEIRIEGKIQKPEAFYVLQKSGINYDWQELKQDFLPKIVESVSKAPF